MKKYKDAKTGHFVSAEYAADNPDTTYAFEPFDVDKALRLISSRFTPEDREKREADQTSIRSAVDPNSYENRIARAAANQADIEKQLEFLKSQPDSEAKQNRLYQALNRLSELLAERGEYDSAIAVCPDRERKRYFQNIRDAIERNDNEVCKCGTQTLSDGRRQIVQKNMQNKLQIVSKKHKSVVTLQVCQKCAFANAT